MRLRKLRRRFAEQIAIEWHPFALRPEANRAPFEFQGSYVEQAWRSAFAMTRSDGITYRMWEHGPLPRWSMPGLYAGAAASRQGKEAFEPFHLQMFQAFFERNEDITSAEVLEGVARSAGLDVETFQRDFEQRELQAGVFRQVVDAMSVHRVTAVPTVVVGNQKPIQGAVPEGYYLQALAGCGLDVGAMPPSPDRDREVSSGWVDLGEIRD